jgi:hypothetical protein
VHGAELDLRSWVHVRNRIGNALQAVHRLDQVVFDAAVLQLGDNTEPEAGTLTLGIGDSQPEQFPVALKIQREGHIHQLTARHGLRAAASGESVAGT